MQRYIVQTDRFGDVSILADDIKDARKDARRRFGIKNPRLVRRAAAESATTCNGCQSRPCCCAKESR